MAQPVIASQQAACFSARDAGADRRVLKASCPIGAAADDPVQDPTGVAAIYGTRM